MTAPAPEPKPLWYGESYGLRAGPYDWRYHFDGTSAPLAEGDDVIVSAYAQPFRPDLFAAYAEPIVARWVVEVAEGAGSFDLWAGVDPDWSGDDPSMATQYLGTLTADGPGTLVSAPLEVIDHAGLVAKDVAVIARLKGAAGSSVQIAQVKLRVWPAAGAGGAWVGGPAWLRTDINVERWYAALDEGTPQLPTYEWAWSQQKELMREWRGRTVEFGPTPNGASVSSFFNVFDNFGTAPFTPSAIAGANTALVMARPGPPAPDPSLDYGFDPNEVWYEEQSYIRANGGGPAVTHFERWTDAATISTEQATYLAGEARDSEPHLAPHPTDWRFRLGPFPFPMSWTLTEGGQSTPLWQFGAGAYVALSVMGSGYYPPAPTGDVFTSASAMLASTLPFYTRIANYEWFNPGAAPTVKERKPRFYVTFTEVDEDPRDVSHVVGIGKPADDLSIFRVPTPLGTLRELRHGEKVADVSVCYPLKVKLEDGSWTVVAGMTPDD